MNIQIEYHLLSTTQAVGVAAEVKSGAVIENARDYMHMSLDNSYR